ncbi:Uma2 family endonuclease [Tranquillimonas alkanivorans]|uniref:Endonuclease, Uma2 family (Restriction endonuclease fold) n=1 Tax=Tranquillimonas alkanivorans TaxID=441119 RepID=A0A1I5WD37_9RHOB|nr:Uma2 family endonuclease [Tranquillimonas alkanivorans]SFQ17630.1 Endonuclease, Uma2 family (restriction endonuclease fold) [Tranquillimonas alkanivorans]
MSPPKPYLTAAHVRLKGAALRSLTNEIARLECECDALLGMSVRIDDNTDREPDVLVRCGPRLADDADLVPDPIIIADVITGTSGSADRAAKLADYARLRTLKHYLVLLPEQRTVVHHRRTDDGFRTTCLREGVLELDPPWITLEVALLFADA